MLFIGARGVTGLHRLLEAAEPGFHLRSAAAILEPFALCPPYPLFL